MQIKYVAITLVLLTIPFTTYASTYGSNYLTGGTPTASQSDGSTYNAEKAVDSNTATRWSSGSASGIGTWWKYNLGGAPYAKSLGKLSILGFGSIAECTIKGFTIGGSNDNSEWTQLASTTFDQNYCSEDGEDPYWELVIDSTTTYQYFKFTLTTPHWGGSLEWYSVYEFQMQECTDCLPPPESTSTSTLLMTTTTDYAIGTFFSIGMYMLVFAFIVLVALGVKKLIHG